MNDIERELPFDWISVQTEVVREFKRFDESFITEGLLAWGSRLVAVVASSKLISWNPQSEDEFLACFAMALQNNGFSEGYEFAQEYFDECYSCNPRSELIEGFCFELSTRLKNDKSNAFQFLQKSSAQKFVESDGGKFVPTELGKEIYQMFTAKVLTENTGWNPPRIPPTGESIHVELTAAVNNIYLSAFAYNHVSSELKTALGRTTISQWLSALCEHGWLERIGSVTRPNYRKSFPANNKEQ